MNDGGAFRERWDMPGWFGRPMFVFRAPVATEDIANLEPVAASIAVGHLEGWLLDAGARRKLLDALQAASSVSSQKFDSDEHEGLLGFVRARLTLAFDSGELVAYEGAVDSHAVVRPRIQLPSSRPQPRPSAARFYALKVVDEIGAPIGGLDLVFKLDGDPRSFTTDGAGVARVDGVTATDCEAIITSVPALRTILEPRWTAPRAPKIPTGTHVVTRELDETLDSVDLVADAVVTLVITPYFHCFEIAGRGFEFGSSFVVADALAAMTRIAVDLAARPSLRAMIFAHSDRTRDEATEKQLSERRAEALFALYTQDADRWEELFRGDRSPLLPEAWGTREIQHMLNTVGCPDGRGNRLEEDGLTGRRTSEALRRFQGGTFRARLPEQTPLPPTGVADDDTRRELFLAYARRASREPVAADRFALNNGSSFMGCGRYNPFTIDTSDAESRRAVVFLFDTAAEPRALPCKIGDIAPCQAVSTPPLTAPEPSGKAPYRCSVYKALAGGCPCQAGPPLTVFRLQLHDDRYDPVGSVGYRLKLPDGTVVPRRADDDGVLRYAVPGNVTAVEVTYPIPARKERVVIPVEVAASAPDSMAFYLAHLRNFGFGRLEDAAEAILLRFQAACAGLDLSGVLDDATKMSVDELIVTPLSGRLQGGDSVAPTPEKPASEPDEFEKKVKAAPSNFYYVAIDGTEAMDSVTFGTLLEASTGWKNLAGQFLEKEPTKGLRLVDPAHPYLPISLFGSTAVVSPNGRNGMGLDDFWMHYKGELPSEAPDGTKEWTGLSGSFTTKGRVTAAQNCTDFMSRFMLQPAVEVVQEADKISRRFVDGLPARGARVFAADLLFVSSHGWLGGYMKGSQMLRAAGATPDETVPAFQLKMPYLVVGRAAKDGLSFRGPKWIILAQCSTVNSATWSLWASLFARSSPQVRGILAYEEASPDAAGSRGISRTFFSLLRRDVPFLEAWKQANSGLSWAAIVHKDALGDTLAGWASSRPLSGASLDAQDPSYLGFLSTLPLGQGIVDTSPPFGFKLERSFVEKGWLEVTPDTLALGRAMLSADSAYRITITAPAGETLVAVLLRMIHIRPTFREQIPLASLFTVPTVLDGEVTVSPSGVADLLVTASGRPGASCTIGLDSRDVTTIESSGAEADHAYFWFHVEITTSAGNQMHDFKTQGLSF